MTDPRIDESSGLTLSRSHPHTVWTANDSGDSARVFAVDTITGRTTGVHTFDADVTDVEALAVTPKGRLLVADIGDNAGSRDFVVVYWFDEPALGQTTGHAGSWRLRYPDGPHDAESIAVNPVTGRVYVVTKAADGAVYELPRNPSSERPNDLVRLAQAPSVATDAVFLADGSALAVRTYTRVVLLDPLTFRRRAGALLPLQPQGETIALAPGPVSQGTGAFLVGSEGQGSLVQRVPVPVAAQPSSGATPRPSATPSSTGTTTPTSPDPPPGRSATGFRDRPTPGSGGPPLAGLLIGAAAAVAVLTGVRVARRRR